jgi:hypothetical protein
MRDTFETHIHVYINSLGSRVEGDVEYIEAQEYSSQPPMSMSIKLMPFLLKLKKGHHLINNPYFTSFWKGLEMIKDKVMNQTELKQYVESLIEAEEERQAGRMETILREEEE